MASVKVRFGDLPSIHSSRDVLEPSQRRGLLDEDDPQEAPRLEGGSWNGRQKQPNRKMTSAAISKNISVNVLGKAQFTMFPSRPSVMEPPALLQKMERVVRMSGLFNDDAAGATASRARLDVMRVVFAMYCDSAKIYKPILGMIQREYEAHVSLVQEARNRQQTLEEDLATDQDLHKMQAHEMKARWKDKLKKANDAVIEWKNLYEQVVKEQQSEANLVQKQKEEFSALTANVQELEAENERAWKDNERLAKEANAARIDAERSQELERQKQLLEAQLEMLTAQLAESKTAQEVQNVHYIKQTREHAQQKVEITKLRKQVADFESVRERLSPRPDWSNIASQLTYLELETEGRSTVEMVDCLTSKLVRGDAEGDEEEIEDELVEDDEGAPEETRAQVDSRATHIVHHAA